jgi:NAD(P)-dependent dehydrogenase (short-subunit alcohol dehydrogenase family)
MAAQSIKAMIDPKDIAALAVFLASDAAKSISGQVLPIDNDRRRRDRVARMERSEIRGRRHGILGRSRITLRSIRATLSRPLDYAALHLGYFR